MRPGGTSALRLQSPPSSPPLLVDLQLTGYSAVALFYLLAVVLAGLRLRRWPTLFLAALSAFSGIFFLFRRASPFTSGSFKTR